VTIDIGKRLKRARESLGLTLEDLEAQTRIQRKYLQAIENGQFDLLPSPIYVRSYIRSYANAVGENPQMLLKFYQPAHRPAVKPQPRQETGQYSRYALPPAEGAMSRRNATSRDITSTGAYGTANFQGAAPAVPPYSANQEGWRESDLGQNRTVRTTLRGGTLRHAGYAQESAEAASWGETPSRAAGVRRPVMPPDVPDPEELGIEREEFDSLPSRLHAATVEESSGHSEFREKRNGSTLGKWYTRLLIVGAILLVVASALFLYYRWENAAKPAQGTQQAQTSQDAGGEQQKQVPKKPRLSVLYTSPEFPDRYELVNADKLEVRIKWLKGSPSRFEIRHEEVGEVVAQGVVGPGKDFVQSFDKEIWLKLAHPNKVSVTINGFPVETKIYTSEKVIRVALIP
jgi:hypothetical protein